MKLLMILCCKKIECQRVNTKMTEALFLSDIFLMYFGLSSIIYDGKDSLLDLGVIWDAGS